MAEQKTVVVKDSVKIDTAVPLEVGTADRAFAEVMRELSEVAAGGSFSRMASIVTKYFPSDALEAKKFMGLLERLKQSAESTCILATDSNNAQTR